MTPAQDPFAAYQPSDDPDEPSAQDKSSTNRKVAVLVGGTTLVGASLAGLAWGMSQSNPEETSSSLTAQDEDLRIDREGAIRTFSDAAGAPADADGQTPTVSVSTADILTDNDEGSAGQGFSDAFRSARDEMGAGKFFTWHGNLYSTNFKEEWEAKPETEQRTYFSGMGLAETDPVPASAGPVVAPDDAPPPSLTQNQATPAEAEPADGIPVSIEELKNAEYSSDHITIVDAVTIQDDGSNVPVAVGLTNDSPDAGEWVHHDPGQFMDQTDLEMDSFAMPHYSSSMTDGLSSDDDDQDTD